MLRNLWENVADFLEKYRVFFHKCSVETKLSIFNLGRGGGMLRRHFFPPTLSSNESGVIGSAKLLQYTRVEEHIIEYSRRCATTTFIRVSVIMGVISCDAGEF